MRKLRVLFVGVQLEAGGSERIIFDLARTLDQERFEVFVAAFRGGVLESKLRSFCKDVFIIEKKHGIDIGAMLKISKIIKKYRIDIVNAHHYMPCFYCFFGTRVMNGKRLVYTEHSVPEVEGVVNCFHKKILYIFLFRIQAVIGVSRAIAIKFNESYPRHAPRFHAVLNGVDVDKFSRRGSGEDVRRRWGLTAEHFVVGTVANFRKVKNHACLIRAAWRLKHSHPQLRLLLVGTGFPGDTENSFEEVRKLISDLKMQDNVVLAGYQENIAEMLTSFDAFCLPSFSEGLPVSLLEAMAARLPVIASDVAGNKELVTHRKTGVLFPSDDDEQLALLLGELISQPMELREIAANGFRYIRNEHSSESWVRKYEALLTNSTIGVANG